MTKSSKKTDSAPIMDVAHPGKSAPADTSRPIIPNRTVLKDPMVVTAAALAPLTVLEPDALAPTAKVHLEPGTTPPAESETVAKPAAPAADEAAAPETSSTELAAIPTVPEPQAESPDSVSSPAKADDTATDKELTAGPAEELALDQATKQSPPESADLEAKAASQRAEYEAKLQQAYDSKQYFLPINTLEKRRSKHFVVMGVLLSILLLAAWANIALDAGLIEISNVKSLTHFFSS